MVAKAPAASTPRQSVVANVLLSLTVSALFLGATEGIARLVEKPRVPMSPESRTVDWAKEWMSDFYVIESDSAGWPPAEEWYNRDGVRDRAHAVEKPEGVWRVVCLGDSVTFGYGGSSHFAYPQALQARLDALGPGVEVFNVSLMAWSTRQERIAYQRIVRKYKPDEVILGICLNDVQELENNLARPPALLTNLYRRSALVRRIINAEGREIRHVQELLTARDSPKVREGFEWFFREVRALRNEVRADGTGFSAIVFPFAGQLAPDAPVPTAQETIRTFCAAEGIPFLDLLPGLRDFGEKGFIEGDHVHLAAEASARVADMVIQARLIPESAYSTEALWRALGVADAAARRLGADHVPALMRRLRDPETNVRTQAAWAVGRIGEPSRSAVPALSRALSDPQESVRTAAALALDEIGLPAAEARPALFKALEDTRQSVRWRAAAALARVGLDPTAIPALTAALRNRDFYVRAFAAWALGDMTRHARAAVPALSEVARDADGGVRSAAVMALGKIGSGDPAAMNALCESLRDPRWAGRWKAARALGKIGPEAGAAVPSLMAALHDAKQPVRREAARALGRIGPRAAAAVPALAEAGRDPDTDVRDEARVALARVTAPAR